MLADEMGLGKTVQVICGKVFFSSDDPIVGDAYLFVKKRSKMIFQKIFKLLAQEKNILATKITQTKIDKNTRFF